MAVGGGCGEGFQWAIEGPTNTKPLFRGVLCPATGADTMRSATKRGVSMTPIALKIKPRTSSSEQRDAVGAPGIQSLTSPGMVVFDCGELTHCECGSEPSPSPCRPGDRTGKTNRRARMCRRAIDPRYGYLSYSLQDPVRELPRWGRRVSGSGAMPMILKNPPGLTWPSCREGSGPRDKRLALE